MRPVVEGHNLVRVFGRGDKRVAAVDDVSVHVDGDELVILMGPSGSGKTTLLAMLGCLLRPSSGHVRVLGKDVGSLSSRPLSRLRSESIGFVFQGFNLLSALSAWENVAVVGSFPGVRLGPLRSRAVELLEEIGLGHRVEHYPAELSAGEKQRVAFVRALFHRPGILFADEPTANLDTDNRRIILNLLRQAVDERNLSVVLATHDERIERFGDRVLRIEDGRLVA
ncbi:MAG: ABC transporter ATP-binding protein [Deltaproteobacteria bacterium]|nr:ABC transporter ATP-binding protein [Deltaproteobacteria bacterium]